jgi:dihydrofolate reductase
MGALVLPSSKSRFKPGLSLSRMHRKEGKQYLYSMTPIGYGLMQRKEQCVEIYSRRLQVRQWRPQIFKYPLDFSSRLELLVKYTLNYRRLTSKRRLDMRKLIVFNHVSLDGYFVDASGSMRWAKTRKDDEEWNAFVAQNASGDSPLIFGRKTYELMIQYWPTPMAKQHDAVVAERMNRTPKVVFSTTLKTASWENTKLIHDDLPGAIRKMKQEPGDGLTVLGSGTLVAQMADAGLIDEYHIVVNPLALGSGRTMFEGMTKPLELKPMKSRTFQNGCVYLVYEPGLQAAAAAA